MRSRAMHAEEKALSACGDRAVGGSLFTTSSPCEMCSKNAKTIRLRISIILNYIREYPNQTIAILVIWTTVQHITYSQAQSAEHTCRCILQ